MTLKVKLVGSSHMASLRAASASVLPRHPDFDLTFFAAPGAVFRKFGFDPTEKRFGAISKDEFTTTDLSLLQTLNGSETVDLGDCDAVVLVGHDIHETLNARTLSRFSVDGTEHTTLDRRLSTAAYQGILNEIGQSSLPDPEWWHWDTPRLFVSPAPRIAENCTEVGTRTVASWVSLVEKHLTVPATFEIYIKLLKDIYGQRGIGLIANPDETYGETGLTKAGYALDAVYIQPEDHRANFDAKHMNSKFGELCLENIIQTLEAEMVAQG